MIEEKQILFVCIENTGRAQVAQAFAEKYGLESTSTGSASSNQLNPPIRLLKIYGYEARPPCCCRLYLEAAVVVDTQGLIPSDACISHDR